MVNTSPSISIDNNDNTAEKLLSDTKAQNELINDILKEIAEPDDTQEGYDVDDKDATMSIVSSDDPEVTRMDIRDVAKLELGETEEVR